MSDIQQWKQPLGIGSSVARQGRRELEQVAMEHMVKVAREQAIAAQTAIQINNTIALARMTRDALKDIPEATELVMPLLSGYSQGASFRNQFGL